MNSKYIIMQNQMTDIHPIKPLVETAVLPTWMWLVIWLVLLVVLGLGLLWVIRKVLRKEDEPVELIEPEPIVPSYDYDEKMKEIEQLIDDGELEIAYLRMTVMMKHWLSEQLGQDVTGLTTTEIVGLGRVEQAVVDLLWKVDVEKFGLSGLMENRARKALEYCVKIIG